MLDDIYWSVFDAEDNKKASDSLRVNGAYVAPSISLEFFKLDLSLLDDLEEQCRKFMSICDDIIKTHLGKIGNVDAFINYHTDEIHEDVNKLMLVLLNILQEKHNEALVIIENEIRLGNTGGFLADSKSFFEFAKGYCEKRI